MVRTPPPRRAYAMGGPGAFDDLVAGRRTPVPFSVDEQGRIAPHSGGYWYHHPLQDPHSAVRDALSTTTCCSDLSSAPASRSPDSLPPKGHEDEAPQTWPTGTLSR